MHSAESTAVETMLAATIVEEIESLSKVMKRYEEKIETACTNLIGITYKDEDSKRALQLKEASWRTVRKFFRKQNWYKNLHDGTIREDDDEVLMEAAPPPHEELMQEEKKIDSIDETDGGDDMSCLTDASDPILHPSSLSKIVGEVHYRKEGHSRLIE